MPEKNDGEQHERDRKRFLWKRIGDLAETHDAGGEIDLTDIPPQGPHLQPVDDKYHDQQEYRKRITVRGGLRKRLQEREKKIKKPRKPRKPKKPNS